MIYDTRFTDQNTSQRKELSLCYIC